MNDNAYQRIPASSSSPVLSSVLVDSAPTTRRRTSSKSKSYLWKWLLKRTHRPTINIDKLVRMRLRWRTVAKILGGILFFKICLSVLGSLGGSSEPQVEYMVMPDGTSVRNVPLNNTIFPEKNITTVPPPPPPIPPPAEAIQCENLNSYIGMVAEAPEVDKWQRIQLGISFGYSAYFDDRLDGVVSVKIMAMADEWLDARPPLCQLWFPDRVEPFALSVNITNFPAQATARYKSVMYTCKYTPTQPDMPPPIAVSMSSEACSQPISMFKIHTLERDNPPENRHKFTVCLASPMRLNFSKPGEMVDWIEIHKIFGVSKYMVYEHDVADNVQPFLNYYVDHSTMEVLKWKLPPEIRDPRESLKAFGQLTLINDCLYRNMYKSKYLIFLDLDEMMVPRGMSKTLEEVLVTTACQDKAQTIIRSAFFRKQWTNDDKFAADEKIVKRGIISLLKTKRERKVLAINVHAKYIVIPELIEAVEQLAALKFLPTVGNITGEATCVPLAKECLLHHYRYYDEFIGDWMLDRKLHEFTKLIVERTGSVYDAVELLIQAQAQANADLAAAQQPQDVIGMLPDNPPIGMIPDNPPIGMAPDNPPIGMAPDNPPIGMAPDNPPIGMAPDNPPIGMIPDNPPIGMVPDSPPAAPSYDADNPAIIQSDPGSLAGGADTAGVDGPPLLPAQSETADIVPAPVPSPLAPPTDAPAQIIPVEGAGPSPASIPDLQNAVPADTLVGDVPADMPVGDVPAAPVAQQEMDSNIITQAPSVPALAPAPAPSVVPQQVEGILPV